MTSCRSTLRRGRPCCMQSMVAGVAGCPWRQGDIVHFETAVQNVTGTGQAYVFYDRNAALNFSTPY